MKGGGAGGQIDPFPEKTIFQKSGELSRVREIVKSWLVYANKFSWITQYYFSDEIKQS